MTAPRSNIAQIPSNPEWLAHRYDPGHDAFHFVALSRADHDQATFLTDEFIPNHSDPVVLRREEALLAAGPAAPVHFIFHSAYCCSTLLARALNIPGISMSLKEPVILNDIIGWRHRGAIGAQAARILDHSLRMLERPFQRDETVIIKPSNLINPLAPAMLSLRPRAKALLLYAPLDIYLGSIARKGMWGRLWVRDLLTKLVREGMINFGMSTEDYLKLTDIQVAAIGWLAQQAQFAALIEKFGNRIATLNSETLTTRPLDALRALASHFEFKIADAALAEIATGPIFTRHSKTGEGFEPEQRRAEQSEGLSTHAAEIEMVREWARALAANANIQLELPGALF